MRSPSLKAGAFLKRTTTSVEVMGMRLPARMMIGTPAHRQVSQCRRTATKVSVSESPATPGMER